VAGLVVDKQNPPARIPHGVDFHRAADVRVKRQHNVVTSYSEGRINRENNRSVGNYREFRRRQADAVIRAHNEIAAPRTWAKISDVLQCRLTGA